MEPTFAIAALSALAQPSRLRVVQLLARHPDGMIASEIARIIDVPRNTMSAHLTILSRAGLVGASRQGREITYRPDVAKLEELAAFVEAIARGEAD